MGILVTCRSRETSSRGSAELDLSRPLDDGDFGQVRDAFHRYAVLVFPEQRITRRRADRLQRALRPARGQHPQGPPAPDREPARLRHLQRGREGPRLRSGRRARHLQCGQPALAYRQLLQARARPWPRFSPGAKCRRRVARRNTPIFAGPGMPCPPSASAGSTRSSPSTASSTRAASSATTSSRTRSGPRCRPCSRPWCASHPASGRKALYLGSHASYIIGRPVEEGRALLKELLEFATQPQFVYRHVWRQHDLVMWDNRCVLHRGRPWDEQRHRRVMHRTTVAGAGPTVVDGRPIPVG